MKLVVTEIKKYFNDQLVLHCPSFELDPGGALLITGDNGSGKTTLLRLLAGALSADQGSVFIGEGKSRALYEPGFFQFSDLTVSEHLAFYRGLSWNSSVLEEYSHLFDLQRFYSHKVSGLSKGWKVRLGLTAAFGRDADLLLLDEPLDGLDEDGRQMLSECLVRYRQRNSSGCVCIASHEQEFFSLLSPTHLPLCARKSEQVASYGTGSS